MHLGLALAFRANNPAALDEVGVPFLPLVLHCCAAIVDNLNQIVGFSQLDQLAISLQ